MMRSGPLTILATLVLGAAAAPATAGAQGLALDRAWGAPITTPGTNQFDAELASLGPGAVIAGYVHDASGGGNEIVAGTQVLATGTANHPSLAGNAKGGAVAAWLQDNTLHVAERRAGQPQFTETFTSPTCCGDYGGGRPLTAVGERGDAVVVWLAPDAGTGVEHVLAAYRPVGGSFGAPEDVTVAPNGMLRTAAIGAGGTVAVGWDDSGGGPAAAAVRDPASGHWGPVQLVGSPQGTTIFSGLQLGVDGAGRVAAAWVEPGGTVHLAYEGPGATSFGPVQSTGIATYPTGTEELAVSDAGEVIVVADSIDRSVVDGVKAVFGTTVRGDVGPASAITQPGPGVFPLLAMNGRGDAIVAWTTWYQGNRLGVRRRTPGGGFGVAVDVIDPATLAAAGNSELLDDLVVDDAGNASAIWTMFNMSPIALDIAQDGPLVTTPGAPFTTVPATLPAVLNPGVQRGGGPAGDGPAYIAPPPAPVVPPAVPVAAPKGKKLRLSARVRLVGPRGHRRAEVRVTCSDACTAKVAGTLGARHTRTTKVVLKVKGTKKVTVALPKVRSRAWLRVRVTATASQGRRASAGARRVRVVPLTVKH